MTLIKQRNTVTLVLIETGAKMIPNSITIYTLYISADVCFVRPSARLRSVLKQQQMTTTTHYSNEPS